MIREVTEKDLSSLLELYLDLHEKEIPDDSEYLRETWTRILQDLRHHIIVKVLDDQIVSSCVCVIVPNLTRNIRPYALIENVVTKREYRRKGFAAECLNYAKNIAQENNCYKIMLLTSAKDEETRAFYEKAGFNSTDKTALIQWL